MRAAWTAAVFIACACAKGPPPAPPSAEPEPTPAPPAPAPLADAAAPTATSPTADAGPDQADTEPEAADPDASAVAWPPGPIEGAPRSKIGLINLVDERLRKGELASIPDGTYLASLCQDRTNPVLYGPLKEDLDACQALTDWSRAKRAVLNFGTTSRPFGDGCEMLTRLEPSELFYAVGDEVYKVKLQTVSYGGGHAVIDLRCTKKGGSARDFDKARANCPGRPWTRVTQAGGKCP